MDKEGVHFVDVFSFLFVGATARVNVIQFSQCRGRRPRRPGGNVNRFSATSGEIAASGAPGSSRPTKAAFLTS